MSNRVIKFRAWDETEKRMTYLGKFGEDILFFDTPEVYWTRNHDGEERVIENFVLMQFTGLLDKNGKEIYEGDIVNYSDDDIFEVKWKNMRHDIENCTIGFWLGWEGNEYSPETIEVIGNIYENEDLL